MLNFLMLWPTAFLSPAQTTPKPKDMLEEFAEGTAHAEGMEPEVLLLAAE